MDIESDEVQDLPEDIRAVYDEIEREAIAYLKRVTDRSYPYQESYPLPMREINGKKYRARLKFETINLIYIYVLYIYVKPWRKQD